MGKKVMLMIGAFFLCARPSFCATETMSTTPVLVIVRDQQDPSIILSVLSDVIPSKVYIASLSLTLSHDTMQFPVIPIEVDNAHSLYVQALDAFFEQEEAGIIIDAGFVPHRTFFTFAQVLLEHYRNDERVFDISAKKISDDPLKNKSGKYDYTYFFVKPRIDRGVWATWRRSWKNVASFLDRFSEFKKGGYEKFVYLVNKDLSSRSMNAWEKAWQYFQKNQSIGTFWEEAFTFAQACQHAVTLVPTENLFEEATLHVQGTKSSYQADKMLSVQLKHPPALIPAE